MIIFIDDETYLQYASVNAYRDASLIRVQYTNQTETLILNIARQLRYTDGITSGGCLNKAGVFGGIRLGGRLGRRAAARCHGNAAGRRRTDPVPATRPNVNDLQNPGRSSRVTRVRDLSM